MADGYIWKVLQTNRYTGEPLRGQLLVEQGGWRRERGSSGSIRLDII